MTESARARKPRPVVSRPEIGPRARPREARRAGSGAQITPQSRQTFRFFAWHKMSLRARRARSGNSASKGGTVGGSVALAIRTQRKRRILLAALAAIALCLLAAITFAPGETAFTVLFGTYLFYIWAFAPWDSIEVPLPEGAGELTFYRKSIHPFFAEYDRHVEIRLKNGQRILTSNLMVNNGARTMMYLHWQPATKGRGPFLSLQDASGVTWANLARPCLEDTFKPTYAIPKRLRCSKDDLPIAYDWRYFGRIEATDTGMRFVTEETWPPKPNVGSLYQIASKPTPLPGTDWVFQVTHRPHPRLPLGHEYWMTLTDPQGSRLTTWFAEDRWWSKTATLFWYPAGRSGGPYLLVGRFDGFPFPESTLIDLGELRTYRALRLLGVPERFGGISENATGKVRIEKLWTTRVSYDRKTDQFLLNTSDRGKQPIPPLPDIVRNVEAKPIGVIDLRKMTFSPLLFPPHYPE